MMSGIHRNISSLPAPSLAHIIYEYLRFI